MPRRRLGLIPRYAPDGYGVHGIRRRKPPGTARRPQAGETIRLAADALAQSRGMRRMVTLELANSDPDRLP